MGWIGGTEGCNNGGLCGEAGQEESCWLRAHRGQMAAVAECLNSRGWLLGPSVGLAEEAGSQSGHEGKAGLHQVGSGVHQVLTNQKDELTKDSVAGVGHKVRLRQGSREAREGRKRSRKSWESRRRR